MPNSDDKDRAPSVIKWIAAAAVAVSLGTVCTLTLMPQVQGAAGGSAFVKIADKAGHGSGVHIGDGYILTAAHVVGSATDMSVVGTDGAAHPATLLWLNPKYDVALMRVADPSGLDVANLDCADLPVGADISAIGNPRDLADIRITGKIAGKNVAIGPWLEATPVDMTVVAGMSGGAVINESGNVSGLVVGTMNIGTSPLDSDNVGIGVIVPSSVICMLIART